MGKPEVIELPNMPAEYHYVQRASCERCGQPVRANRIGSRGPLDNGRINDIWELTCTKCGHVQELILSIPLIDLFSLLGDDNK